MVTKIGIIGFNEGNGHPFSFSAIFNGFSEDGFSNSGWPVIHNYLKRRHPEEFGINDCRVTHAWTQDSKITEKLCAASLIPNKVDRPKDLIGEVDAVIIARDDYKTHLKISMPFLEANIPVFLDKPLTDDYRELIEFTPYLKSGKLMSCSGMRFAPELDDARQNLSEYGHIPLIRGSVVNGWEKYAIHLIDAILNLIPARPVSLVALDSTHESVAISLSDGSLLQLDALGDIPYLIQLDIYGQKKITHHILKDNFLMFKRALKLFVTMIETGKPPVPVNDTLISISTLIAGRESMQTKKKVLVENAAT